MLFSDILTNRDLRRTKIAKRINETGMSRRLIIQSYRYFNEFFCFCLWFLSKPFSFFQAQQQCNKQHRRPAVANDMDHPSGYLPDQQSLDETRKHWTGTPDGTADNSKFYSLREFCENSHD